MTVLTCARCRVTKDVADRPVEGKPLLEWWASVGELCAGCRAAGLEVEPRKLTRSEDPATSQSAACGLGRSTHRRRLLEAFTDKTHGLTFAEAGEIAGLDQPAAWRRTSDLLNAGYIETIPDARDEPVTRRLPSGKLGRVYRITPEGFAALDGHEPAPAPAPCREAPGSAIETLGAARDRIEAEDRAVELILATFPGSELVS